MTAQRIDFKHVREQANFEAVASHYGLVLIGKGDQRTASCCFHKERTPSLKIHLGKKVFNCFGCGAKGNILDFVTRMEGGNPANSASLRKGAAMLASICSIDTTAVAHSEKKPEPKQRRGPRLVVDNDN